jgi:hypothetical protein
MEDHLTLNDYRIPQIGRLMQPGHVVKEIIFNVAQLPCGWLKRVTEPNLAGVTTAYYVNPELQKTQWLNPAFDGFNPSATPKDSGLQKKEYRRWKAKEWDGS